MTPKQEAAIRQALEAFERMNHDASLFNGDFDDEIASLREALAEQEKPVDLYAGLRTLQKMQAQHQEELNKFAEDSVWDGEGP